MIIATSDSINVFEFAVANIPISKLLSNDIDLTKSPPLTITEVCNVVGGRAAISGGSILFNCLVRAGETASFKYRVKNKIGKAALGTVNLTVLPTPSIVARDTSVEIKQDSSFIISNEELLKNVKTKNLPVTISSIDSPVGGTLNVIGNGVEFTPNVQCGKSASFRYTVQDSMSNNAAGNMWVNLSHLPDTEAFIFNNTSRFNNFIKSYAPPSRPNTLAKWNRIENNELFQFANGTSENASGWKGNHNLDRIETTKGSSSFIGLIDPSNSSDNFTFEADLGSTCVHRNLVGVIVAFRRMNNINHYIAAIRTTNGFENIGYPSVHNWSLVYNLKGLQSSFFPGSVVLENKPLTQLDPPVNDWHTCGTTRVKVIRRGNIIECFSSPFGSNVIDADSKIVIDLEKDARLDWAKDTQLPHGYCSMGQTNAIFSNPNTSSGIDTSKAFDAVNNLVYEFKDNKWQIVANKTIAEIIGYPRTVTNPDTGLTFNIDYSGNIKLSL